MKSRNKKYVKILFTMFTAATILGTTACSSKESKPDKNMEIKLISSQSLVDAGGAGFPWSNISFTTNLLFRNLFIADATSSNVAPDLAESFTVSDDGLTYVITMKTGQLWSDGEALDLEDVIFSIESVNFADKKNAIFTSAFSTIVGAEAYINGQADSISGMVADGNTLTINLEKPYSTFAQVLAQFAILPEHLLGSADLSVLSDNEFWNNPIVSGMYKMGEHVPGESLQYVYNENYGGETPYINSVLLRADYEPEELDYYDTNDISQIQDYRAVSNKTENKVDNLFYRYFIFNMNKGGEQDPVMSDIRVRKAITYAINREQLVSDIYYSTGEINNTGVVRGYNEPLDVEYPYDPEMAKQLLAEAEYDFDRPLVLLYYYNDETSAKFMEQVQIYLEEVGFTVELLSGGNLYNEEFDSYDVGLKGLAAFSVSEWYTEYQSINQMHTEVFGGEPMFDELIDDLSAFTNNEEKLDTLKKLQELEYELLYKYPVFTMGHMAYTNNNRLELPDGVNFGSPRYKYDIDFENWKIKN